MPVARLAAGRRVLRLAGLVFSGAHGDGPATATCFGDLRGAVSPDFFKALKAAAVGAERRRARRHWRLPLLPQIVDTYILSNFLFYLVLMLASFVSMILVFNFFELMGDMSATRSRCRKMFTYLFFLTPQLIYEMLPVSVLVAVLVTFGVLSKQNEITAFKACGVSLYRLAVPILLGSTLFSGGLFAFDYLLRAGRQPQAGRAARRDQGPRHADLSAARPQVDHGPRLSRIYYYKYFDTSAKQSSMNEVSVFELEPKTFRLARQISPERAHWSAVAEDLGFRERLELRLQGRVLQRLHRRSRPPLSAS